MIKNQKIFKENHYFSEDAGNLSIYVGEPIGNMTKNISKPIHYLFSIKMIHCKGCGRMYEIEDEEWTGLKIRKS